MADPIPDAPGLGPEDLTAADFSKSKRGYDPVEVTTLLGRGADALRAWQERDRRLQERITTLSAELDAALDIDEQRITEALGSETARIIAAARDAAASIRNRATAGLRATKLRGQERRIEWAYVGPESGLVLVVGTLDAPSRPDAAPEPLTLPRTARDLASKQTKRRLPGLGAARW